MKKLIFVALASACMYGCNTIIDSTPYYQTTYDSNCLYSGVTWSDLVLCQQKDLDSEWEQNRITNELLSKK